MRELISVINGRLPRTGKDISISVGSKNVIITGMNGCGKTVFLKALLEAVSFSTSPGKKSRRTYLLEQIAHFEGIFLNQVNYPSKVLDNYKNELERNKRELSALFNVNEIDITWKDHDAVLDKSDRGNFIVSFFEATRQYSRMNRQYSQDVVTLAGIKNDGRQQQLSSDFSVNFESYLVAFFEAGYMASMIRNDPNEKLRVDNWLSAVVNDLRYLFEDDSLLLTYNEQEKCFYINQREKTPYTFSTLSSGYSSILRVYADLLMKVELHEINKEELSGVVIIDEIDAHLHISLQKKIFSFLARSYPKIQFIVSTHSPFVLQSVDDAVIYDLSKLEQLEDLSFYSYDAIAKGLLGVNTNSQSLSEIMSELSSLTSDVALNRVRIQELIEHISPVEARLDSKSKVILLMAKQAIEDFGGL
ncbi:AAA family ATPase [Aeromonas hydrophila]|uniref:AAA family ATPase n=1 Tax=Aeromonas hydrophila TaxID=644 RepID=UPI001C77B3E5|nr:AAA family ATPase [Aeromonas hydrophila]QWL72375.1 AAA family ATPase [Aeromonas hydrophila]